MFTSIRSRLWLTYTLLTVVVLCVVAAGLLIYLIRNPLVERRAYLGLERIADTILSRPGILNELQSQSEETASRIDDVVDVRILILNPDHSVSADSRRNSAGSFGPLVLRTIHALRGLARDQAGQAWIYVAHTLADGNILVLATPRPRRLPILGAQRFQDLMREDVFPPFLTAGCLALGLGLLLALGMARWIASPLQNIAFSARQVADGHYQPIALEGPTEVKQLARAIDEMGSRVQSSQQSQRDLVANVSHELKTPLTSIQGFAQAIIDGTASSAKELQQAARVIYSEADRMNHLVIDLLDLARFDAGIIRMDRDPINLPELLKSVASRFETQAQKAQVGLQVHTDVMPELVGDASRLEQVFSNLVDNALKHTPPDGLVELSLRRVGEQAYVTVSDTGHGIQPEDQERIFERFYQLDRSRRKKPSQGAGLGLSIAREIVLAHGGTISVQNIEPQGSVFMVKIPFAHPAYSPQPNYQ